MEAHTQKRNKLYKGIISKINEKQQHQLKNSFHKYGVNTAAAVNKIVKI